MEHTNAPKPLEKYFTVRQISLLRNLSPDFVRRIFLKEIGVVVITHPKPNKRIYRHLLIPESVVIRVFARYTNGIGRAA